jgi:hypothetical protein
MSYSYTLYPVNSTETPVELKRSSAFTLEELQSFVGGRIEIIPHIVPGVRGYKQMFVVCEDGFYKYRPNPHLPQFRGPVLIVDKKLIK